MHECRSDPTFSYINSPQHGHLHASPQAPEALKSEVIRIVRAFFAALDTRDIAALEPMFLPDAVVVSDNGMTTDVATTMRMIRTSSGPAVQRRETCNFHVRTLGKALIVGFLNRVTLLVNDKPASRLFEETWVFVRVGRTLKLAHVHYSLVAFPAECNPS